MSKPLLLGVAVVYLYAAVEQFLVGNRGLALAFFSYALGNVGWYYVAQ